MIVKRYVVKDMPEAVVSIRRDLGKDAVILSTKKVRVRKWLGLRWQNRLEVTAALGGDIPLQHRDTAQKPLPNEQPTTNESMKKVTSEVETATEESFHVALNSAFDAYQRASSNIQPPSAATKEFDQDLTDAPVLQGAQSLSGRSPVEVSGIDFSKVLSELETLKLLVTRQSVQDGKFGEVYQRFSPSVSPRVVEYIQKQGLGIETAEDVLRKTSVQFTNDTSERDQLQLFLEAFLEELHGLDQPAPIQSSSKLVAFVGPTGVGKTTSIAKIAALHVLASQRKVGFLTLDTFRIAAVEQLRTYADILDVPLAVAQNETELPIALERLEGCDLILVDTAGHSFRDPRTLGEHEKLLRALSPDETILVLSLTAKGEDIEQVADRCFERSFDKFLFTKMDETNTVGTIPKLVAKYQRPVSYITMGQNVPNDIDILPMDEVLGSWAEALG